jgi:hypothetical protein
MRRAKLLLPLAAIAVAAGALSMLMIGGGPTAVSATGDPNLTNLPLGDGKTTTTTPQSGYLFLCRPQMGGPGGGAQVDGPWIHGSTYDLTAKYIVDGSVSWPHNFKQKLRKKVLKLTGNGLPNHTTGTFPVAASDDAAQVDRNPNQISPQSLAERIARKPKFHATPKCTGGEVGVMKTGAALFNAVDAQGKDAVAHEVQDSCSGHPQNSGVYHYHGLPACLNSGKSNELLGWALDGFPIFGPHGTNGVYLSNALLDECHGITSKVKYLGKTQRIYHYVANYEFPYTVGCFRGDAVQQGPPA